MKSRKRQNSETDAKLAPISVLATVERFWPDGSGAVSALHESIGGVEFDISCKVLPKGIRPGDQFKVCLYLDSKGQIISHQVRPDTRIAQPEGPSIGSKLSTRVPSPPKDRQDLNDVARCEREMQDFETKHGLRQMEISD